MLTHRAVIYAVCVRGVHARRPTGPEPCGDNDMPGKRWAGRTLRASGVSTDVPDRCVALQRESPGQVDRGLRRDRVGTLPLTLPPAIRPEVPEGRVGGFFLSAGTPRKDKHGKYGEHCPKCVVGRSSPTG
jgi:hypothetical protein